MVPKLLEAIMLICFGCSWPFNVYKSFKTRSTKGKSLQFLILIITGYIAGSLSKIFNPNFDWANDLWIFAIYILNLLMVSTDLFLYFVNLKREKKNESLD